jgi:hypothetical protein
VQLRDSAGLPADFHTGLERTDNDLDLTSWPQVNMINQKNYYTCVVSCASVVYSAVFTSSDISWSLVNSSRETTNSSHIAAKTKKLEAGW